MAKIISPFSHFGMYPALPADQDEKYMRIARAVIDEMDTYTQNQYTSWLDAHHLAVSIFHAVNDEEEE